MKIVPSRRTLKLLCAVGVLGSLAITLASCGGGAQIAAGSPLGERDLQVTVVTKEATLRLQQPIDEVVKLMGDPGGSMVELKDPPNEGAWDAFKYDYGDVEIGFMRQWRTIDLIVVRGRGYVTPRGVRVGDDEGQVRSKYGEPRDKADEWDTYVVDLPAPQEPTGVLSCVIAFKLAQGKVAEIWVNVAVD